MGEPHPQLATASHHPVHKAIYDYTLVRVFMSITRILQHMYSMGGERWDYLLTSEDLTSDGLSRVSSVPDMLRSAFNSWDRTRCVEVEGEG